jgi:hypothetical protein
VFRGVRCLPRLNVVELSAYAVEATRQHADSLI